MNLYNNRKKKHVKIDKEDRSNGFFSLLDEVNSDLEEDVDNVMNDLDMKFELEEGLENKSGFGDVLLNLLLPEANYHVVGKPTIENTLEEGRIKN